MKGQSQVAAGLIALTLCLGCTTSSVYAASSQEWFQRFLDHYHTFYDGSGFLEFDYRANDRISNDQADLMESFLYAYRISGDTEWLDEFVRHGNAVVAKVGDLSADGKRGWDTARYSQNLIGNDAFRELEIHNRREIRSWSFEEPSQIDPTLPEGWVRSQGDQATVFRNPGAGLGGSTGVVILTDGRRWSGLELHFTAYEPGTHYYFECSGWTDSDAVSPNVDVRFGTEFITPNLWERFTHRTDLWQTISISFKAPPEPGVDIIIRLVASALEADAQLRFDDCKLGQVTEIGPRLWRIEGVPGSVALADDVATLKVGSSFGAMLAQRLWNPFVTNNANYEPGIRYRVRFAAATSDPDTAELVQVVDRTTGQSLGAIQATGTNLTHFEFEFLAPGEAGSDLWLEVSGNSPASAGAVQFCCPKVQQFAGHIVDEALILNVLLRFVNLVRNDGAITIRYQPTTDAYTILAREIVSQWEEYWVDAEDFGVYVAPDDGAQGQFARCTLPANQFVMAGLVLMELHSATLETNYLEQTKKLANAFRRILRVSSDAYTWDYYTELLPPGQRTLASISPYSEDISHANADIGFVAQAYRRHIAFSVEDIRLFLNTFLKRIIFRRNGECGLARDVAGAPSTNIGLPAVWWWAELAGFNPEVLFDLEACIEAVSGIETNGPIHSELGVWYDQGWRVLLKAMLAYFLNQAEAGSLGPQLSVKMSQNWLTVTWPAWFDAFHLETSENIGLNLAWNPMSAQPQLIGGVFTVREAADHNKRFFRLRKTNLIP